MSTLADWDADVAAQIVSTITTEKQTSIPADASTPERSTSDLRRERLEPNAYRFQIRHAQQGESLPEAAPRVATEIEIHHRLGVLNVGIPIVETEREHTTQDGARIQATLSSASTWRGKSSVRRVAEAPVASIPEVGPGIIDGYYSVVAYSIALVVELTP